MPETSPGATLATLRRLLLGVLLVGLVGTGTELLLMGHDEDAWQMIPLVALGAAVLASLAMVVRRPLAAATVQIRLFRFAMGLLVLSGATGTVLHYRANMEFKLEMDPSMSGVRLFWSVIQAKAPPALAPGNMALLGLLGLACAFRLEDQEPSRGS